MTQEVDRLYLLQIRQWLNYIGRVNFSNLWKNKGGGLTPPLPIPPPVFHKFEKLTIRYI